jgi:hypothetical protein
VHPLHRLRRRERQRMGCCVRTVGQRQRHLVVRRPAPQLIAVLGILGVAADATGQDPAGALEMGQINGQAQRRLARALWETLNRRIQPTADSTTNANATPTVRAKTVDWSDGMLSPPIASPPFCSTLLHSTLLHSTLRHILPGSAIRPDE